MKHSKIQQTFSEIINKPEALDSPEDFLGMNP
jgi:hypothetical protein